ncbi:SHD1 domain-containing protein [Allorhodopirellula solitaria]|uniref:SLA1 homology domain-containing protein n=1 Tax=Allorhodopirellula solitaria TaxID=2527987 RepID=A0A5C5YJC2_9BACT|nr:SHD1 domain-containing protein [Allorhodopirellula solitaria]TWT74960.1 hypothetical protein CA85_02480 [Allorhodopirellula solitaria]
MFRFIAFGCLFGLLLPSVPCVSAETWTDTTGKFAIEAEFQGVEGKSIILLRANGQKITVPIAKLSPESRAQAKALYQAMMRAADEAAESDPGSSAGATAPLHATRSLNFQAPTPPAISAMPSFPDGMSVEQTLAFVQKQVFAGHPGVFWYALPKDMRKTFDDPRLRKAVNPFVNEQQTMITELETLVFKSIEVLVTKKDFVLGSKMLEDLPPPIQPLFQKGYDPAVGVAYEVADFGFSFDPTQHSVTEMVDYHFPRIGAHLKSLLAMVPDDSRAKILEGVSVEQIDADHAIVHLPPPPATATPGVAGPSATMIPESLEMVRVDQRWVPKKVVDSWRDLQSQLDSGTIEEKINQVQAENVNQTQGASMMLGMFKGMIESALDSMLAAKTQEEFDAAFEQQAAMPGGEFGEMGFSDGGEVEFHMGADGMEEDKPLPPASGSVPEGWALELDSITIPETPAVAYFSGEEAPIVDAVLQNGILELWDADEQGHFNDSGFVIFLFLDEGESVGGKTFSVSPKSGFGSPHVHRKLRADNMSDTEMMMNGYAMELEFGEVAGGKVTGKIYLCLPDEERSMVSGTFAADVSE